MSIFGRFPQSEFEVVSPEGEVRGKARGVFGGESVTTDNIKLMVLANDEIRRTIPSGAEEVFTVVDPKYFDKHHTIPAHYQIKVRRKGMFEPGKGGYYNITVSGENARVNVRSTDNSTNTVNNSGVFADLIGAIEGGVQDASQKAVLIEGVREMEKVKGTSGFTAAYTSFVSAAANHIAVITPFLPALSSYLAG